MQRKRKHDGFTLVEIMIVLAILVLLLAMVGPRLLKTQEKADLKITVTQIKNVEQALDMYKVDNRAYPSTEEGLKALLQRPADEARAANWEGPYLSEATLPVDPWGNAFRYEYPPTKGMNTDEPNIWSAGPDGKDDTEDDIVNWTLSAPGEGESTPTSGSPGDLAATQ
jgi:general secretion pathway protein G